MHTVRGPSAAATDLQAPTVRLEETSGLISRVLLTGSFPAGWAGRLALGLSLEQVTILRGCACRAHGGGWSAYFDLHALAGAPALRSNDYCALALHGNPDAAPVAIELESYSLVPTIGGWLQLGVRGHNCVGFLGNLLDHLAGPALSAEEMSIETDVRGAEGRFHVCAPQRQAVSLETRRSLETLLDLWVRPPQTRPRW